MTFLYLVLAWVVGFVFLLSLIRRGGGPVGMAVGCLFLGFVVATMHSACWVLNVYEIFACRARKPWNRFVCRIFSHKRWGKDNKRYLRWLHDLDDMDYLDPGFDARKPFEYQYVCGRCGEDLQE